MARNIAALGATCMFVGLVGEDEAGLTLRKALTQEMLPRIGRGKPPQTIGLDGVGFELSYCARPDREERRLTNRPLARRIYKIEE